ncbi:MAG: hypothetical protein RL701_2971 [Pseudomonadota bacterium]
MVKLFKEWHGPAICGALLLVYLVYAKWSVLDFRKHAVRVKGQVKKVFPHRHFTSYFLEYDYSGTPKVAEYCGAPLLREFSVGDHIEVMIDGRNPPNVAMPGEFHNAPGARSGDCELPGESVVSFIDVVYAAAAIYLIAVYR